MQSRIVDSALWKLSSYVFIPAGAPLLLRAPELPVNSVTRCRHQGALAVRWPVRQSVPFSQPPLEVSPILPFYGQENAVSKVKWLAPSHTAQQCRRTRLRPQHSGCLALALHPSAVLPGRDLAQSLFLRISQLLHVLFSLQDVLHRALDSSTLCTFVLIPSSMSLFREAFPTSPVLYGQTPSYSGMLQEDRRSRMCKGLEGQLVFLRRFTRPLLLFWIPPLHPRAEASEGSLLAPRPAGRCVAGYWRRRAVWGLHWEALNIISGGAATSLTTKFPSGLFWHVTPSRCSPL